MHIVNHGPGGHWPRKGVRGCAALKTPFSRLSCSSQGPISSKIVSLQDPLLRKFWNFSLNSLNFCPNFSSQAPKFVDTFSSQASKFRHFQFKFTSPKSEIFSSQAPPQSGQHTPTWKKIECPPPDRGVWGLLEVECVPRGWGTHVGKRYGMFCGHDPPGGFLVQRSIWGRGRWNGSQNQPPGITMTPYSVQKLV